MVDRKTENEIDIITINELDKTCKVYEVKRQASRVKLDKVETKAQVFMQNLHGYTHEIKGLSMDDM